ncbi:MAG: UDP-N-acetylmuramoyl-L-alanine--D-glutamate ligase [Congregibacter sp.]
MRNSIPDLISSTRRKVVVGLGPTGLSVARHLYRRGEEFAVFDTRTEPPALATLKAEMPEVSVLLGEGSLAVLDTAGELIVSPGISPAEPWLQPALDAGARLSGDADLFVAVATAPVVGITGSNAKSTVTEILGAMVRAAGRKVGVGGNLGTPMLDLLDDSNELYVIELSSFQLERAGKLNLAVATVLNLSADHLDRHGSMQQYHRAKHRIFDGCDCAVVHSDDPLTIPPQLDGRRQISWRLREPELHGFGIRRDDSGREMLCSGFDELLAVDELSLPGRHNVANALAALALGTALDLPREVMLQVLRTFPGLPHRCEPVPASAVGFWINDSKATNVGAAMAAISGLGEASRLILIAGGRDKGADFRPLRAAVAKHCDEVLLIGEAAQDLAAVLKDACKVTIAETLEVAVAQAAERVSPSQTVLFSPACASFDQFNNFGERGDAFRQLAGAEVTS